MGKHKVKGQGNTIHSFSVRSYKVMWDRACTEGGANELLHLPNPTTRPLISQLHSALTWNESPSTYLNSTYCTSLRPTAYLPHHGTFSSPTVDYLGAVCPLVLGMYLLYLWPANDCLLVDHMKCVCISTQGTSPTTGV